LPESPSGDHASLLGLELAARLGTPTREEPIGPALAALGCYRLQDEAVRLVFPEYESGWPFKIVRSHPNGVPAAFSLVLDRPGGRREARRMPTEAHRLILTATNTKQRLRTLVSHTWADRLQAAVAATPNLLELDPGLVVRGGHGLSDLTPIAGMDTQQVYALARHLRLPDAIASRPPTAEASSLHAPPVLLDHGGG
jgi:NAD+ synthase